MEIPGKSPLTLRLPTRAEAPPKTPLGRFLHGGNRLDPEEVTEKTQP